MTSVTTKEVFIRWFKLSDSSFESIIKAGCNSDRIVFRSCLLDLDKDSDIDISGPDYKTTYLSFRYTGKYSDWNDYPSRLRRIIKAISLSSLNTSLQTLDVKDCGLEEGKVMIMLREFNLEHVMVVQEDAYSLDE